MSEPYFDLDKLKVGDKLWDAKFGWGEVDKISMDELDNRPIKIKFFSGMAWFTTNGSELSHYNQTLFYDEISFAPPPRPKRLVKKTVEFWYNVYRDGFGNLHSSEESANLAAAHASRIACVHLTGEYEVEE